MQIDAPPDNSERLLVLLAYGLFLIAPPMGGITALIGVIIAHVRLGHARGGIHESHYRNLIRLFWTMLLFALCMVALFSLAMGYSLISLFWPFAPGWPVWPGMAVGFGWAIVLPVIGFFSLILVIWYYWRLIRGFIRALDDKPY